MSTTTTHRNLIIGGAALVAVVAMAASAATLAALGRAVGWGNVLSWALPVSVDVLALVAGLAWIAAGNGSSLGRVLTLLTVAVSVLLNALGHLVSTGHLTASPYLVIGVSAVPPLAAALAVHLGATVTTDRTAPRADHDGRVDQTGPAGSDQGAPADQMPDREHPRTADDAARTTDQPADSTLADHDAPAPDRRTNPVPDHDADHNGPTADQPADHPADQSADQQITAGPQQADSEGRTSNAAGQAAPSSPGPADHARADHDAPAPDQRTNPAPDHDADHNGPTADQPADQSADPGEDGSSGGPQGARTTGHDAPAVDQRTKPADQDEVPWEAKVAVARKAALKEGRMTRRAIRPHLRKANITVSNELFSDLQAALYADPALAHLPRDTRRAR